MNIKHKQLKDAMSSLIMSHTFYSAILLQQEFVEVNDENAMPTAAVDGEHFFYNPKFIDSLNFDETKGLIAHEANHLALIHHVRMGDRDSEIWNYACDYAINADLLSRGFKLPPNGLNDPHFANRSAEDIYSELMQRPKNPNSGNGNKQGNQGGNNPSKNPNFGGVKKSKKTEQEAKSMVQKAMSIAKSCGDDPAKYDRIVKELAPRYDWREILHRFFSEITASDYSLQFPNRRFIHASNIILPSLRSRSIGKVIVAVDTSGSVSEQQCSAMVSEIFNCLGVYEEYNIEPEITVIYCDAAVNHVETLHPGDKPHPKGGGGTDYKPIFKWIEKNGIGDASCLVTITDGFCNSFPEKTPEFPCFWALINDNPEFEKNVPFGECFKFDIFA